MPPGRPQSSHLLTFAKYNAVRRTDDTRNNRLLVQERSRACLGTICFYFRGLRAGVTSYGNFRSSRSRYRRFSMASPCGCRLWAAEQCRSICRSVRYPVLHPCLCGLQMQSEGEHSQIEIYDHRETLTAIHRHYFRHPGTISKPTIRSSARLHVMSFSARAKVPLIVDWTRLFLGVISRLSMYPR